MGVWFLVAALVLGAIGIALLARSRSARRVAGLPPGKVTYVDTGAWDRCERPLYSPRYRLAGRPDYLVRTGLGSVPVEVKSGLSPVQPYETHVLQLAAYCLLIEEQEGRPPGHGIIKYRDRAFEVEYTPPLRAALLGTMKAMRSDLRAGDVGRSHDEARRCAVCGLRDQCDQRLGDGC